MEEEVEEKLAGGSGVSNIGRRISFGLRDRLAGVGSSRGSSNPIASRFSNPRKVSERVEL